MLDTLTGAERCQRRMPTWYAAVRPVTERLRCWQ